MWKQWSQELRRAAIIKNKNGYKALEKVEKFLFKSLGEYAQPDKKTQ